MDPTQNPQYGNQPAGAPQPGVNYGAYGPQPAVAAYGQQPQAYAQPAPVAQPYPQAAPQQMYAQPMGPQQYGPATVMPNQPQAYGQNIAPAQQAGPVPIKTNPNSTQNTLQIAEIRDGIVIMNDGSFRSVIMLKSINFDLMSNEEREGVEYGYQGFLNSLYFPVQIFVRSQKVDLRPYLDRLEKIRGRDLRPHHPSAALRLHLLQDPPPQVKPRQAV